MAVITGKILDNGGAVFNVRNPDFGATGNGTTDDTAAIQAAVNAASAAGGGVVFFPAGTYLATSVNVMPGVTLEGYGARVRRPDGTPGRYTRMFTTQNHPWVSDVDSPPLVFRGLVLDGNRQNQGAYTANELEHAHLIFLMGDEHRTSTVNGQATVVNAPRKGRLRAVVEDCIFLDSPGDGLSVYTGVQVQVSNCSAVDCFRGGLVFTGGHTVAQIDNFVGKGDTHPSGLQFETDGAGHASSVVTDVVVNGVRIDGDFDCAFGEGSTFVGSGIVCHQPGFYLYAPGSRVRISNSLFAVGAANGVSNRIVHPGDTTFADCRFVLSEAMEPAEGERALAALDVAWNISGTGVTGQRLRLTDCVFDTDASVEAADTLYAVRTTPDGVGGDNRLYVDGGEVSAAYDYGLYMSQGGTWSVRGMTIAAQTGIFWSAPGGYSADITVDAVVTRGTTSMHINTGSSDNVLTLRNVEADEAQSRLTSTYSIANRYRGGRVIWVDSSPEGRLEGLLGDRARLKQPVPGAAYEWVCVTSGFASNGTVVWKAIATVAA
jgi:hypothetical protein